MVYIVIGNFASSQNGKVKSSVSGIKNSILIFVVTKLQT